MKRDYKEKFYRNSEKTERWISFNVKEETTDLFIRAKSDLSVIAEKAVARYRDEIRRHIDRQNEFLTSLDPVAQIESTAVVHEMYTASKAAGVGPMAAVAGAIAQAVGLELTQFSDEVIVENGGDIFVKINKPIAISIFGGNPVFTALGLKLHPHQSPLGICTSSGRIGHSLSFGNADAVTIIAADAALADAVATQACNIVRKEEDADASINYALNIDGVKGIVIIYKDKLFAKGDVEFV